MWFRFLAASALVLAGCAAVDDVYGVVVLDQVTQAVTSSDLRSVNGTYGSSCTDRTGAWSVEITSGAPLDHDELSVVRNDATCVLTLTTLVADQPYPASPALAMTATYQGSAAAFSVGASVAFYANARFDSTTFASDFAMTILVSDEPGDSGASVTAQTARKLMWFGDGTYSQGADNLTMSSSAVQVGTDLTWKSAATGLGHTCATRTDGTLWCWGLNDQGQIGNGSMTSPQSGPVQIGSVATWDRVATGHAHSCAIRVDNSLWCWGWNTSGQLGIGNVMNPQRSPIRVGTGTAWASVSAGHEHACATRTDGTLWCWGSNGSGQLGGGLLSGSETSPTQVGSVTTWNTVSAGHSHTCATRTNGSLWCWGLHTSGRLGLGLVLVQQMSPAQVGTDTTWTGVAAGGTHTCATRAAGSVWCWGLNSSGQLGTGSVTSPKTTPAQVGSGTTWNTVVGGSVHSCATRNDRTLWCWGDNLTGQLGLGHTTSPQPSPSRVGAGTVLSVITSSTAFATFTTTND